MRDAGMVGCRDGCKVSAGPGGEGVWSGWRDRVERRGNGRGGEIDARAEREGE